MAHQDTTRRAGPDIDYTRFKRDALRQRHEAMSTLMRAIFRRSPV